MEANFNAASSSPSRRFGKARKKKGCSPELNSNYLNTELQQKIAACFRGHIDGTDETTGACLHTKPFPCCVLPNFVHNDSFLDELRDELLDQIFYEKNNDLYKFQQTNDLKKIKTPLVNALRKLLYVDFLDWLRELTGIPLTNKVDMTCSKYEYTDALLCHDDELEGRRIAFILYLVPLWRPEDGGALQLFDMDELGQPRNVVSNLLPVWNNFVWFEVTHASFHQVAEVLTEDKTRLSISGWFHGPAVSRPPHYIEPSLDRLGYTSISEEMVQEWINPIYLQSKVQGQIQEKFESDSEVSLQEFFKDEKYQEIVRALESETINWQLRGPPNKRHYLLALECDLPEVIQQCLLLLRSEAVFLTLAKLTGLALHELAEQTSDSSDEPGCSADSEDVPDDVREGKRRKLGLEQSSRVTQPSCRAEVRKWTRGCYTLVHDTDSENSEFALDVSLFFGCDGWTSEYGGYTSYIAKGEDEELLSVCPCENSLALVYRDKDTLKFVKHINSKVKELQDWTAFYEISFVYYE